MALQIRRGTNSERLSTRLEQGEISWTTDTLKLYVGDGTTMGGRNALQATAGSGLVWNATTQELDFDAGTLELTTDIVTEGTAQYFTANRAKDAIGPMLQNAATSGITFTYNDVSHTISVAVAGDGTGLLSVAADPLPHLGGNLSLNSYNIVGTGDIDITGLLTTTSVIHAGSLILDQTLGQSGILIQANAGGNSNIDLFTINTHHDDIDAGVAVFSRSRGTYASPTSLVSGDGIFNLGFAGSTGNSGGIAAAFAAFVDGAVSENILPGKIVFYTSTITGVLTEAVTIDAAQALTCNYQAKFADGTAESPSIAFTTDAAVNTGFYHPGQNIVGVAVNGVETARFDVGGIRSSGFVKVADVGGTLPSPAEPGMIVLDGATFKGYNGTSWVTLG